jgi:hypothetical protein
MSVYTSLGNADNGSKARMPYSTWSSNFRRSPSLEALECHRLEDLLSDKWTGTCSLKTDDRSHLLGAVLELKTLLQS